MGEDIENRHYIEAPPSEYPEDDGLASLYPDKESLLPLIREDLVQYCLALNPRWRPARHLLYLADRLMAAERRELTRLVVTMPPQHGKSWTTSEHFPAWYLGRHPDHSVITAAYNETKALDFGLSVKDQVNDPLFRLVFPGFGVRRDSNSALKFTTEQGGSYFAVGRGGSATNAAGARPIPGAHGSSKSLRGLDRARDKSARRQLLTVDHEGHLIAPWPRDGHTVYWPGRYWTRSVRSPHRAPAK